MTVRNLQTSDSPAPQERRHRLRHKLYTPVFASFSGPHSGLVLDLSELLDLNEEGFAVQTGQPLEVNRPLTIFLDLPETRKFVHAAGHVVWSDSNGRSGVRFASLTEDSRKQIKEWMFVNALVGCSNRAARIKQLAHAESSRPEPQLPAESPVDVSGLLASVGALRDELLVVGRDSDTLLQLITERAASLLAADGAALAYSTKGALVCRGTTGSMAPPLGVPVDSSRGLTGECVRLGCVIACQDSETDDRVDREICRALGIRSILAAPIVSDYRVTGLLEVFSSQPNAFPREQEQVLERIAQLVPAEPSERPVLDILAPPPGTKGHDDPPSDLVREVPIFESEGLEELTGIGVRWTHLALLGLTMCFVALALGYILAPTIEKHWLRSAHPAPSVVEASAAVPQPTLVTAPPTGSIAHLKETADSGDPQAQYEMGFRCHTGDGVPQNDKDAVKWFIQSAQQGHVVSQAMLGYFFWAGQGVPQDIPKAYFWSILARAGGDEASKYRAESIASKLTRAQALAIQREADAWLREHSLRSSNSHN